MNTSMDKLYTITSHIVESTWYVDIPKLEYELRWAPGLNTPVTQHCELYLRTTTLPGFMPYGEVHPPPNPEAWVVLQPIIAQVVGELGLGDVEWGVDIDNPAYDEYDNFCAEERTIKIPVSQYLAERYK